MALANEIDIPRMVARGIATTCSAEDLAWQGYDGDIHESIWTKVCPIVMAFVLYETFNHETIAQRAL